MNTQQRAEIEADDLLTEIMLRLPLYSIHRFKLVCKQWNSLITSSEFRKLRHRRNPAGLILQCYPYHPRVCLPFSSNISITIPSNFVIEQSCNGLLLSRSDLGYHVYNPTTKKYRTVLELHGKPGMPGKPRGMNLAFDPTRSPYYKVISTTLIFGTDGGDLIHIHVYSSRTRCWTSILESSLFRYSNYKGIYWNGSINWIADLLYFNIEDQTLKPMPVQPDHNAWRSYDYLGESCGRLNCCTVRGWSRQGFFDVYELKRDYSHWVLKWHFSIENCDYSSCRVLSVVHGLDEDDSFLVLKIREKIVRYNPVSTTSEELYVLRADTGFVRAFQYFESLCDV